VRAAAATWTRTVGGTRYFKRLDKGASHYSKVVPDVGAISFMRKDDVAPRQFPYPDFDMHGNDLADFSDTGSGALCPSLCHVNARCLAYTYSNYNGGASWLKTKSCPYVLSPSSFSVVSVCVCVCVVC
jgi:hypothetical protein